MNASTEKSALLLLDLQNEMVDLKGKIGGGGLAAVVKERHVIENAAPNAAWHAFSVDNILPMFGTVTQTRSVFP
ncbi:hypothetical protein GG851_15900 [Bordetella petrii]|nr:hypothetical protein [Bordetella petrii]